MDWTKIIWALLLGAMILFLWPRAKHMLKNSPKAQAGDWQGGLIADCICHRICDPAYHDGLADIQIPAPSLKAFVSDYLF
ncbi:MAG: hypothetical protein ABW155_08195 [Candidatus Thiodiazotropha sp.]